MTITFRLTVASKLFWAGRPAMRVIKALHWLSDLLTREGKSEQITKKLNERLKDPAAGPSIRAELSDRHDGTSDIDA